MKTPFPPFLSSLLILDVKRNVTFCPLAFARNVSYFIPALYRAFIVPRFSRIVSLVRLLFIFLTFKHPLFVSLSFFFFHRRPLSFPFLYRYLRRGLNINELYRMEVIVMYVIASAVDWISALWLTIIRLPHENSATRRLWRVARCRNYVASQLPNKWPRVTLDTTTILGIITWPQSCNLARLYWKMKDWKLEFNERNSMMFNFTLWNGIW